ncbi:MAG: methyltransferase [Pseudomonadota bacterium]
MSVVDHLAYALSWLSFGALHSLLAGSFGRGLLAPWVGCWHRLAYNLIAVIHLAAIWVVGRFVLAHGTVPFDLPHWLAAAQVVALVAALGCFWFGGRRYDAARFVGLRPEALGDVPEPLVTGGLHRWVRHPLYVGAYLLLWGLVDDPFSLATAIWASAYLVIGTHIEERRLERLYGPAYVAYRRAVPPLWRRLTPW